MNQRPPRSAGELEIGSIIYQNGVFSVEMLFRPRFHFAMQDEIKSATLVAAQQFFTLLHQNGFHDHGEPETKVSPVGRGVHFFIACKAARKMPAIIMLPKTQMADNINGAKEEKPDDEGGGQVDDET